MQPATTEKSMTIWTTESEIAEIDRHVAGLAAGLPHGARLSRQQWLRSVIRAALGAAQAPVQP